MVLKKLFEKIKTLLPEEEPPQDWASPLPLKPLAPDQLREAQLLKQPEPQPKQESQPCPPCPACPPCPPCPQQKQETPQPLLGQLGAQGHQVPGQPQPGQESRASRQGPPQPPLLKQGEPQGALLQGGHHFKQGQKIICPRCGASGRVSVETRSNRKYVYVRHQKKKACYIGPADGYAIGKLPAPQPAAPAQPS